MASTSKARRGESSVADDISAGGKTLKARRNPRPTPYTRPSLVTTPSPNWLTGVVLPKIATGAASLLFSFISSPEDSEDSSSSEEGDDSRCGPSPADGSDESTHSHYFIDGVDTLNKGDAITPEFDKSPRKESRLTVVKSETKHLIEKLIMQETFSREERDNLMVIINSRVIDDSTRNGGLVATSDIPDFCTKAIMEAKQWIEGKKESSSKPELAHGISTPKSVMLPQDTKGGLSSPVDMAKAYMRDLPPWSPPSLNSIVEKTPSRVRLKDLMDEASHRSSFSSSKHKLSSRSWSIQDEIRRVRSKATEDMLKTVPSLESNLSSFSLEPEGIKNTFLNGKLDLGLGGRLQDSNLFPSAKLISTSGGLPASDVNTTQDGIQIEDLHLRSVTRAETKMVEEDKCDADGSSSSATPEPISTNDLRLENQSYPTSHGDIQSRGTATSSGFILSESREVENNGRHSDDKHSTAVCSSEAGHNSLEDTCELLSETSVEIPGMNEADDVALDNALSNSVKHTEEPSKQLTRPKNPKQVVKVKSAKVGIGQGRKLRPRGTAT